VIALDGGPFLMGDGRDGHHPVDGEGPVREVRVPPFSIAAFAVTDHRFAAFADDTGYVGRGRRAFCAWAGVRLPSEPAWEYAARAGARTRYPWGDALEPGRCNTFRGEFPRGPAGTAPVDAHAPNAFGLHNVIGNVWEWTADPFAAPNGRPGERAIRGGSYLCHPAHCNRNRLAGRTGADRPMGHIGFRVACS